MKIIELINETPLPSDWDSSKFNTSNSFESIVDYALERSKKIGTGSSRIAFEVEYEGRPTILKIAKNKKGLAQNEVESKMLSDGYIEKMELTIPLIDYDTQIYNHYGFIQKRLIKLQKRNFVNFCIVIVCFN